MRGVPRVMRGAMYSSVQAIMSWVFGTLQMQDVFLRVFSDNVRAIQLYEHCGFRETMRMPMRRAEENGVVRWIKADGNYRKPDRTLFRHDAFAAHGLAERVCRRIGGISRGKKQPCSNSLHPRRSPLIPPPRGSW